MKFHRLLCGHSEPLLSRDTRSLSLGWKVSNEVRVNWKASLFTAFGFERPTDANQFGGIPCRVMFVSLPPLQEAVLVWPLREALLFPCIWLSVCMRDSFLFICPLVDARIPQVDISHLLRALDHVVAS